MNFLQKINQLIIKHNGNLNGGLPEGRIRAIVTNSNLSEEEKELYKNIKEIFDKNNILAPEIKLGTDTRGTIRALRSSYNPQIVI